jgi:large subunit ribosomal protein L16
MKGRSSRGNHIGFGRYALQALEPAWITAKQIEAGRRAMTRYARRGAKIWVRLLKNPTNPLREEKQNRVWVPGRGTSNIG